MQISSRASPRLKDAQIRGSEYPALYEELILNIRKMYHQCKLVHADLSEYNILYHDNQLYIIDVSQSVEHDHPSAFDFLRNDLKNVEEFFGRFGVRCLGLRRCFDFITKEKLGESGEEDGVVLKRWLEETQQDGAEDANEDATNREGVALAHEDSVFLRSYIPRTLNEVYDPERDVEALKKGRGKSLIYADTIGLVEPPAKSGDPIAKVRFSDNEQENAEGVDSNESEDEQGSGGDDEEEDSDGKNGFQERTPRGHRHEDREAKKASSP